MKVLKVKRLEAMAPRFQQGEVQGLDYESSALIAEGKQLIRDVHKIHKPKVPEWPCRLKSATKATIKQVVADALDLFATSTDLEKKCHEQLEACLVKLFPSIQSTPAPFRRLPQGPIRGIELTWSGNLELLTFQDEEVAC